MHYTLQGVPQFRIKLHCGTPFLMVRNLSDYRLNSGFVFADIWKRFDWHCPILLWRFLLRLRSYSLRLKNFPAFAGESCQATPAGRCFPGWTPPHTGKKNVYRQTGGFPTMKFVCPKMKWEYDKLTKKSKRVCHCEDPCTESSCGRMFYLYPEKTACLSRNTAWYTGMGCPYKIRVNVEKSINHFKDSFCVAGRKTQNEKTLHADLLLARIAQLVTVMVAGKIHKHQYIHSLKPLIA